MGGPRPSHIRITRPTALLSAVATLFAALFICLTPGAADPAEAHHRDASPNRDASPTARAEGTQATQSARATSMATHDVPVPAEARYTCPYEKDNCGLFPHRSPAVLTVPPPTAALTGDAALPHLEPPYPTGQVPRSGTLARAPDLHVLQVLRT
ncbi:hypothetical protein [Streptomyces sp. NPDC088400]|uniref:hypothetical protein n=1 Tax=Streptomyces sp. NPDC088400 TaxID=3365861 RepID=UPI0038101682